MIAPTQKQRVALLGLGIMGSGMAGRLLAAGFPLTVFNRTSARAAVFEKQGATFAASPRDAARDADVIVSMVADDNASRAMWLGENGALAEAARGALLIECSTVTVGWVKELASAVGGRGCELLDAPVTGSKTQAAAGELNFLVGGSTEALERGRPVLAAMARGITHLGPTGSGALMKLINNFVCGVQAASLAEAIALMERSGLDRAKAVEVLNGGAPGSPLVKLLSGRMCERNFSPNFLLRLMAKDLGYALEEGNKHSLRLSTAATVLDLFQRAIAAGDGDKDFSAIVEQFRRE